MIRVVLIYTFGFLIFLTLAVVSLNKGRASRKKGNSAAYDTAVYKAWASGLICVGCVLVIFDTFLKNSVVVLFGIGFFVSAGILQIWNTNRCKTIQLTIPKISEGELAKGEKESVQDVNTVWPPAPIAPDNKTEINNRTLR